jgi:predicted dehydrogenase
MVNFGIVGFGLHAVKRLMPGFALAKNCRVTALSRRNVGQAKESARQYNIPFAFDSAEELSRSPQVDAVLVTTPNSCHLNDVMAAIACGKPVLCEKPLGINADECRQMVTAAERTNTLFGVAHVFRFEESVARFRDHIGAGLIGKPLMARSEFSFEAGPEHPRTWIHDRSVAGGGPIVDIGVHCIDTLRYVLDDEVVRVSTRTAGDARSGEVEATAALLLEFSHGTLAAVLTSFRAPYRTPLEVIGDAGSIRADQALNVEHPIDIELLRDGTIAEHETVSNHLAYALQVDEFALAIEGKAAFRAPGKDGWQNQEVLDAAFRSALTGRSEEVPQVMLNHSKFGFHQV